MKTILIPTDFSPSAESAMNYAIELAKKDPARFILLNVYNTDGGSGSEQSLMDQQLANAKKESEQKLAALCSAAVRAAAHECIHVSKEGYIIDAIVSTIKEKQVDLVIMGTKGSNDFVGAILGSNTAKIIETSICPVIAVPEGAVFNPIKKITYATAYHHSDERVIKKVVEMAKLFNAQVNVLHVPEKGESAEFSKNEMETFMKLVNEKIDYSNISFQILDGNDTESALEEYIEDESTDMLVMSTHHRSFFDKLFGKSVTKRLALQSKIPLMAFHYTNRAAVKLF